MAKIKDSRSCFRTRWRIFYKCMQLVQGEIMLILITIILLLNFKKNISYVFLFLRNFKISFPSVFTVYLALFWREKRRQNLTTNLNKVCLHAVAGFATHCAAMSRCSREAKFEEVQRHYTNIYQSNFLLSYVKFIPL